jgi:HEAT repeat protein
MRRRALAVAALAVVLVISACATSPRALIDTVRVDPDDGHRRAALLALEGRVADWMVPALKAALSADRDTVCRTLAAERLGQTRSPEAAAELRTSTHTDKAAVVRRAALYALSRVDVAGIEPDLRKVIENEPAADIRELALLLAQAVMSDPEKRKAFALLATEDTDLRVRRAAALLLDSAQHPTPFQ